MAKEKIKTCEEYVLNILAQKEEELEKANAELEILRSANQGLGDKLNELTTLVKAMASCLVIKKGSANYDYLYAKDSFIGLVNESTRADSQDQFVLSLIRLADFVGMDLHTPVEREE